MNFLPIDDVNEEVNQPIIDTLKLFTINYQKRRKNQIANVINKITNEYFNNKKNYEFL